MSSSILALRRIPAVSTNRIGPVSVSTMVSMASRVVPGRLHDRPFLPDQAVEQVGADIGTARNGTAC